MITLHFQSDDWRDIAHQMRQALCLIPSATQPASIAFPDYDVEPTGPAPEPDSIPEAPKPPKATSRKPRSTQTAAAPAPEPEPAPNPEPEAEPESPAPARDLPSIDALKAIVTQAVRLAQKKEGPAKILDLLPGFKTKTGLGFVMEATDAHREALADLIDAAGLVEATA